MKSKIQIEYHIEGIHNKTLAPTLSLFYYKSNSTILYFKEISFIITEIFDAGCSSPYDYFDKNFNEYETVLFYNQYKASIKDVNNIFDDIQHSDPAYEEEKSKLYSIIRKNKIDQIIN